MTVEARCREAAKQLSALDFVRVFSDDDADGIAAAGILSVALHRQGIPFHLTLDRLDASEYASLDAHDTVLLLDQGAGELASLADHPGDVFVLDHHVVQGTAPRATHVNPNLEGVDGTDACCTATLAMLTALQMDPTNSDLAPVAMAGIVGDRQHVPRVQGPNAALVKRLTSAGTLEARPGLPFKPQQPLEEALSGSVDPFLAGLSGSASRARAFLEELGVDPTATTGGLAPGEMKRLASALVARMLGAGIEPRLAEEVVGSRFLGTVAGRSTTASRLSALFNACARVERPGLGVSIAHGDRRALEEAGKLVDAYEEDLLKGLLQLQRGPPQERTAIQHFDAIDPDLVGAHCGIGMAYLFPQDKPCFGLKESEDGRIKVSGRATGRLVDAGVDLAQALRVAADEAGGSGGGHPIAAGCAFPAENREAFLERLDAIVGEQLHATTA